MPDQTPARITEAKIVKLLADRAKAVEKRIQVTVKLKETQVELQHALQDIARAETALAGEGFIIDRGNSLACW